MGLKEYIDNNSFSTKEKEKKLPIKEFNKHYAKSADFQVFHSNCSRRRKRKKRQVQADIRLVISFDPFVSRHPKG